MPGTGRCYDVAVVGAGPAGAAAALDLAAAGADVLLLERNAMPRYKTCGGGLVPRAKRAFAVDVSDAIERECYAAEINALGADLSLRIERPAPVISMTMRDRLDGLVVEAAERAGACVRADCAVHEARPGRDRVELETAAGRTTARFVVAADGALSRVARSTGWRDGRHLIPALESELYVGDRLFESYSSAARFDIDVLPHGYGWVFPKREHLSVGVASFRRGSIGMHALLDRYCERLGLDPIQRQERHGFVIPVSPRRDGFVKGRILLAGDAAGLADPVTAEGISFAVHSGRIAARILWEARFDLQEVGVRYPTELEQLLEEIRFGRRLARLLLVPRTVRPLIMRLAGQRVAEGLVDVFCGATTYRSLFRRTTSREGMQVQDHVEPPLAY